MDRFKRKENAVPGPGNYNTSTTELSREGKYSVSNLQNSKVRSFGHAIRKSFANRCQSKIILMQLLVLGTIKCQVNLDITLVGSDLCKIVRKLEMIHDAINANSFYHLQFIP